MNKVIILLTSIFLPITALAHTDNNVAYPHHWGMWGGGYNWVGWITMILFWALLILGILYLWKNINKK